MSINYLRLFLVRVIIIFLLYLVVTPLPLYAVDYDSIYVEKNKKTYHYNSDIIFSNFAKKGFVNVIEDFYDYYEDIFLNLPQSKKISEIDKMNAIAKTYKSEELSNEVELLTALILPDNTEELFQTKINTLQAIADKADKRHDTIIKLRVMESILDFYWTSMRYAKAFRQIHLLDKVLQNVSDETYPGKGRIYFRMGEAYYFFRDYDKSLPYLRKSLKPSKYYYDHSNLQARNTMGNFYNNKGNIDSAEYYFRSAFNSYDIVKDRSVYDAVSLSNLGECLIKRKKYDEAIPYFEAGLARILIDNNYKLASNVTIGLADCYLKNNNIRKAKQQIDSSLYYIKKSNNVDLYQKLYPIMCKYYAKIGNSELAKAYLDSTIVSNQRYFDKYNSLNILRAEQEIFELETKTKDEQLRYKENIYNNRLSYGIFVIIFISIGLIIFIILYTKNKKAYQALVKKNQDWAGASSIVYDTFDTVSIDDNVNKTEETISNQANIPDEEDINLMKQVDELIKNEKIFNDIDLTLDSLSKRLNINRNYLSKAINKTTGKNFNTYINEYRVKEAIRIMSDQKSDLISIDAIALDVGFSNRTSFYQSFKKITGLSPSDFRNNKTK